MNPFLFLLVMVFSPLLSSEVSGSPQQHPKGYAAAPVQLDELLGIRALPGAFVNDTNPGSPAQQAGLDVCDLIAGFNDQEFRSYGDPTSFLAALREAAMFSGADLDVWTSSDSGETYHQSRLRVRIPSQPGAKIGADVTFQVLVAAVTKGGSADVAGVRPGEFIDQVNGQQVSEVRSIIDLDRLISASATKDGQVLLTLAQWKPVRGSPVYKTRHTTRDVTLKLRTQG